MNERWQRVKEIFEGALERQGDERARFLDRACDGDAEVRPFESDAPGGQVLKRDRPRSDGDVVDVGPSRRRDSAGGDRVEADQVAVRVELDA